MQNAKIIELNNRLTPELLVQKPEADGFLAIFMFRQLKPADTSESLTRYIYKFDSKLN